MTITKDIMCNDEVFIKIICLHKQYFYFFPHDTVLARYVLRSYDVRPFVCLWSIRTPRHVVKKQRCSVAGQHVLTIEYVQYVQVHRIEWLGCRVVSVLDSGAEGPGFKSQPRRCRVTFLLKLFTPIVPLFTKRQNW